jgi:hypothetical protein
MKEREKERQKDFAERGQVTEIRNAALGPINSVTPGHNPASIVDTTDGPNIRAGPETPSTGARGRSSNTNAFEEPPRAITDLTNATRNLQMIQESKQAVKIEREKRKRIEAENEAKRLENEAKRLKIQEQDQKAVRELLLKVVTRQP